MASNFLAPTPSELERDWGLVLDAEWALDVRAGGQAPIVRRFGEGAAAQREVVLARFGLMPQRTEGVKPPAQAINARAETMAERATFQAACAQRQWCIVPAQCFYVPLYAAPGEKATRWRVRRRDRAPLSIAGLWDRRVDASGAATVSFAIITMNCDLHPLLSRFGRPLDDKGGPAEKRTPSLLTEEDYDDWLDASPSRAPVFLGTFGKDDLEAEPAPSGSQREEGAAAGAEKSDDTFPGD